jgi:hypothetical protein
VRPRRSDRQPRYSRRARGNRISREARLRCPHAPSPQRGRALPGDLWSLPDCRWGPDSGCTTRNSRNCAPKHSAQLTQYRRGGKSAAGDPHPRRLRADHLRGQGHSTGEDQGPRGGIWLRHPWTTSRGMRGNHRRRAARGELRWLRMRCSNKRLIHGERRLARYCDDRTLRG